MLLSCYYHVTELKKVKTAPSEPSYAKHAYVGYLLPPTLTFSVNSLGRHTKLEQLDDKSPYFRERLAKASC